MTVSHKRFAVSVVALGLLAAPTRAHAAKPKAQAEVKTSADAESVGWLRRFTPRRNMFELGIFGGIWAPADDIELHFRDLPFQAYEPSTGEIGGRVGYYPMRHFGFEGEIAMMPTRTQSEQRAFVSSGRAHAVLQLGLARIIPFAVVGGGVLAVRSEPSAVGDDADQVFTVGGGVKFMINEHLQLRLEARDTMSPKRGRTVNDPADTLEVLAGFSVLLGPRKAPAPTVVIPDTDGDGFFDDKDKCVREIGVAPDGCPVRDADDDGFADDVDQCPDEPGTEPDGCPIPDTDGDGFLDPDDSCPDEAGVDPDGCPIRDEDGDGLLAPEDQCPTEPETRNGFEDSDGCPDELPEAIRQFTGVIEGIYFATGKAKIQDASMPALDAALAILTEYPDLRVEVSGHTDDRGKAEKNLALSAERAASVRQYLLDAGIAADRIETRGVGSTEPLEDNKTKAGRAKNRRIEFKLLVPAVEPAAPAAPSTDTPDAETPDTQAPAGPARKGSGKGSGKGSELLLGDPEQPAPSEADLAEK